MNDSSLRPALPSPRLSRCRRSSISAKEGSTPHPDVMFVMMADITAEATMAEMERKVNFLMKVVEEREHEITTLREQMRTCEMAESIQQLQDMTTNSIRAQYGGPPQTSFMYFKLYTKRIDNLRMPLGGDQLVRQFVRNLKGNAFEWYIDLEPEVIDSWKQLERSSLTIFIAPDVP
ncbi:ty3-gypsy retrotransposon protein [Cucumis melo var. makuwa]|uniref:Ty3-gypsy retrotransposon protein n=1 Tax=Cucumis melo var. makuwa TaxID=1194695 RepID=A0A5D3DMM9_CUCMM|nr:ty3-gypsy retrotransposon protein [Cucumis melo var. makuwa]TYK24844.1 ty3-gypsy retrotransposon protein [Cucumis melo var. makuwa]